MKEGKFSAKLNNSNNQQHQNGHLSPFKLAKLLDPEASWDKDQLGDVLHWIRQFVALVCGLLWGAIPLVGGIWIGLFLLISSGIIYVYYAMILKIDEDDFGGHGTLLQEGLFASITLFLMRIKIRTPGNPNCGVEKTNKLASKIVMDCTGSELLINPV